jgi:hypothetical protein
VFGALARFVESDGDLTIRDDSARIWMLEGGARQFPSKIRMELEKESIKNC